MIGSPSSLPGAGARGAAAEVPQPSAEIARIATGSQVEYHARVQVPTLTQVIRPSQSLDILSVIRTDTLAWDTSSSDRSRQYVVGIVTNMVEAIALNLSSEVFGIAYYQDQPRTTHGSRTFSLAEAGLTEDQAAGIRRSLQSFASGWDDPSLNAYNAL